MTALLWCTELAHGIGETITYDYDVVGQFTLVALPDGGALRDADDKRHRLVGMNDSLCINVAYTQDDWVNRALDRISGASDTRARHFAHGRGALNRLLQQTGAAQ